MSKWRNNCPDVLFTRIENVAEARLYILRQTGPTGFLLKEDDSDHQYKVFLGDPHCCNCTIYKKEKELCKHILWLLLKKFRIPKENPVTYQLGLCERELQNVLNGLQQKAKKAVKPSSAGTDGKDSLKQKAIDKEDICPICQEDIYKNKNNLTFCRYGCGNSVHIKCMKIWADHQFKSTGEDMIKCPLCRSNFLSYKIILQEHNKALIRQKMKKAEKIFCTKCQTVVQAGQYFRCAICSNILLCHKCFPMKYHVEHQFEYRKSPKEEWKKVRRFNKTIFISPSVKNLSSQLRSMLVHEDGYLKGKSHSAPPFERSSPKQDFPSLENFCFGVNGIQKQESSPTNPTNANRKNIKLPPLPMNKSLSANAASSKKKKNIESANFRKQNSKRLSLNNVHVPNFEEQDFLMVTRCGSEDPIQL